MTTGAGIEETFRCGITDAAGRTLVMTATRPERSIWFIKPPYKDATTASPISRVPTRLVPGSKIIAGAIARRQGLAGNRRLDAGSASTLHVEARIAQHHFR